MAVVDRRAGLPTAQGFLHSIAILKFAPVVDRYALEYPLKVLSQFPLQSIQYLDYAPHGMVWHSKNEAIPGKSFRQYQKGSFAALAAHDAVHFPIPKSFPLFYLCWAVLYGLPFGLSGPLVWLRLFLVVLALIKQVFFAEAQEDVAPVDVVI